MRPGPTSAKNAPISASAQDLGLGGLGDELNQQLQSMDAERKKKLLQVSQVPNQNGLNSINQSASTIALLGVGNNPSGGGGLGY